MKLIRKTRKIFRIMKKAKWIYFAALLLLLIKLVTPYVTNAGQFISGLSKPESVTPNPSLPDNWVSPEPGKPESTEHSPDQLPLYNTLSGSTGESLLSVSYINVGQGDSILLQLDGRSILVDGGNRDKGTLVQKYLTDRGITHLDAVISTHGDADHCSGLRVICQKFNVDCVYMSYLDHDTNTYQELKRIIKERMIPVITPLAGDTMAFGQANITFVSPVEGETDSNAASLAFLLEYGSCRYLFCGDAEKLYDNIPPVDVLMAPHHGSYTGNDIEKAVSYKSIVISASGVDYGHPHGSTMDLINASGTDLYRTDKQGTIVSQSDGNTVWFDVSPCQDYEPGLDLEE